MEIHFRPARADDWEAATPLVYSSGPDILDHCFRVGRHSTSGFLSSAFADGRGFFGWRNHTAAEVDGHVVAVGAFFGRERYDRMTLETLAQVVRHYPFVSAVVVLRCALHLRTLMPAPSPGSHYVANLGVAPALRGRGIGAALLRHQEAAAVRDGRSTYALDVAVNNPRARGLYERLGFRVTAHRPSPRPLSGLPGCHRMEKGLAPACGGGRGPRPRSGRGVAPPPRRTGWTRTRRRSGTGQR